MKRPMTYAKGHPLSNERHVVRTSRFVLYNKLQGKAGKCNWCNTRLSWKTLCADHLDGNTENNHEDNLVGSCRGCNANRENGTGHGRKRLKKCARCGRFFMKVSHHKKAIYCGLSCSNSGERGTKSEHGTRNRYVYGCRCEQCKEANTTYSKELYNRAKNKTISAK